MTGKRMTKRIEGELYELVWANTHGFFGDALDTIDWHYASAEEIKKILKEAKT